MCQNIEKKDKSVFCIRDLINFLIEYKKIIIIFTSVTIISTIIFCVVSIKLPPDKSPLPNEYTSTAKMLIREDVNSSGLDSILNSSGLGVMASVMGIGMPNATSNKSLAQYFVSSNSVLDKLNDKFDFTNKYKIKKNPKTNTRKAIKKRLKTEIDEESGVFSISFTDINPVFAQDVTNSVVILCDIIRK